MAWGFDSPSPRSHSCSLTWWVESSKPSFLHWTVSIIILSKHNAVLKEFLKLIFITVFIWFTACKIFSHVSKDHTHLKNYSALHMVLLSLIVLFLFDLMIRCSSNAVRSKVWIDSMGLERMSVSQPSHYSTFN